LGKVIPTTLLSQDSLSIWNVNVRLLIRLSGAVHRAGISARSSEHGNATSGSVQYKRMNFFEIIIFWRDTI
jgi:hypothetical protein